MSHIIAIFGPNGSGKTLYAEQMRRQMASDSVRYMAFCDSYGAQTDRAYYLQLRWNQHDIDAETPTVGQVIDRTYNLTGSDSPERREYRRRLVDMMSLNDALDKYVIQLSSGELRKLQLVKTLLSRPKTLIIDNPFIGLDSPTRQQLKELLPHLATEEGITIYLLVARKSDIPEYADEIKWNEGGMEGSEKEVEPTLPNEQDRQEHRPLHIPPAIVEMNHVSIRYGDRVILNDINWTIRKGEHWALSGRNGSGKSTLLSLICADNPQGYACDISLFGRHRGSGETIWDIKRRIGYVSPEMHRSYQRNLPAIQVVASGLKDTVGLYTRPNEQEKEWCRQAMRRFGIDGLEQRPFLMLSSGEQRLILLARAFVKNPELLILDEPLHGLDDHNQLMVKAIIDHYCSDPEKTLIMVSHYEEELPNCINKRMELFGSEGGVIRESPSHPFNK